MTTEYFTVKHTASKTVYFRFFDPSNSKVYDFDDDAWEANLAACTDPKLAATEKTDPGDADESLYVASYDLATIYNTATAKAFIVQAVDDLATDEIIAEGELWIYAGSRINGGLGPSMMPPTLSLTNDGDGDAVTATVDGDDGVTNYIFYKKLGASSWTQGQSRSGDGTINQTGLDDNTWYTFHAQSKSGEYWGLSSIPISVYVTSGSTSDADNIFWGPVENLRTLVAASATFQAWVSATGGNEAELIQSAKAHVYIPEIDPVTDEDYDVTVSGKRPYALIDVGEAWNRPRTSAAGYHHGNGSAMLMFEDAVAAGDAATAETARKKFQKKVGDIVGEMEVKARTGGYLLLRDTHIYDGPKRPWPENRKAEGDFNRVVLEVEWGPET